ncbi:MAG: TonB-dependent receptor [Saprospiraceae bacterium]|nr:TonB-dependent receptor [Saprospiraceae bacterium]
MKRKLFVGFLSLFWTLTTQIVLSQDQVIKGVVIDRNTEDPLEYASITIYSLPDSTLLSGVVTDSGGIFRAGVKGDGPVYLVAQFIGYDPYVSEPFTDRSRDFGKVSLQINATALAEVKVTGKEITTLHRLDKQVFRADQFEQTRGGSATDILKNLPSVSVNAEGEISIRGTTGFVLMINGKPVQTSPSAILGQIAANAVEDIEIITAPSAKYDPDGKAGIINIKTRKGVLDGFFLSANAQLGSPSIEPYANKEPARRYNADVTLNYKKDKWDISAGIDYKRDDISGRRVGYVNTYRADILTEFPSFGERSFDRENYSGRTTVIFAPNSRQSIGAGFYAGKRTQYRTADILYDNQQRTRIVAGDFLGPEYYWDLFKQTGHVFSGGEVVSQLDYYNENLRVRRGDFLLGSLDYTFQLNESSNLKVSSLYERTILGGPTDSRNLAYPNFLDTLQLQFNDNYNPLDGFRFQMDYSTKIKSLQWESGYQYRFLKHPGDFIYLDKDFTTGRWVENPEFTNRIDLRRNIHSLYSQMQGGANQFKYTAGLRLEYFDRQVGLDVPDTTYLLDQFNLFPSFNFHYQASDDLIMRGGYSRRIERTTTFTLTPFPEREHSETLEQGDAQLLPEFIDLTELGLVKNWGEQSGFINFYWRNTKNVINRVNTIYADSILNRIYTNAGVARALGAEIGLTLYPARWLRITLGGNVFRYRIKGKLFEENINTSSTMYSINANSLLTLSPTLHATLAFNYLSEQITAQGRDSRFYNPSLSLRKTFKDSKWAISLQWLNIDLGWLDSNEQRITTVRSNFFTTTNYIYEVDIVMLGVSCQLNQPSKQMKLLKSEFGDKEF